MNNQPKDQETISEDAVTSAQSASSGEVQRSDIFRRFSVWLTTKLQPQRKFPVEKRITILEDEQVTKRLVGEVARKAPGRESSLMKKWRNRPQSREDSPVEPKTQLDSKVIADQPQTPEIEEPNFDRLRTTASEGYDPTVRGEIEVDRSIVARLRKWFNKLSKLQKMIFLLGALFALGLGIILIFLISSRPIRPVVTPSDVYPDSIIPIPILVILPDSLSFELGVGTIINGSWTPQAAEWLAGTEVPRWLALPWDKNLESAVLKYEINEPIHLQMSNTDILVFRFQSVQEISAEEMGTFHANTADLLIILSDPKGSTRLVIIAVP